VDTTAGTASPRALRKSSCGGWRATCSATWSNRLPRACPRRRPTEAEL